MPALRVADAVPVLVATPVMAVLAWWVLDSGGYAPAAWLPGTALVLCLAGVAVLAGAVRRPRRAALLAVAALAGYTAWSFASVAWADAPGTALEGSQRTLLYLACFTLFAALRWTPRAALWTLGAFVVVATAAGIVTLMRAAGADQPVDLFIEHRLAAPLGYQNASAALWTMAALPALALACSREVSTVLRPLLLGSCALLLGLAVLAQSRGWLFTLPLVALVTLALVPARARLVVFAVPVAAALGVVAGDLLEPYRVGGQLPAAQSAPLVRPAIDAAVRSLLLGAGAIVMVGALLVAVDRLLVRRPPPDRARRLGRRLAVAATVAVAAGGAVAAVAVSDEDPVERVDRAWSEFTAVDAGAGDASRFTSLGGERYDLWRVAVDAWAAHPLGGLGQDNYAEAYVRERSTAAAEPRWVHSLPLRLLAHTGLVGAALFVAFAIAALIASARPWRRGRASGPARLAGAAALLPATVWLVHGSVDWLWEYPALSGAALAFAGIAVALGDHGPQIDEPPPAAAVPRAVAVSAAGLAVLGLALLGPAYVGGRDVRQAAQRWPSGPEAAFARLDRAAALNPLDVRPPLVEGVIAARTGDLHRARRAFGEATDREPHNWFARLARGLVESALGDPRAAARHLRGARRLNPRERLVHDALRRVDRPEPMSLSEALRRLERRVERLRA